MRILVCWIFTNFIGAKSIAVSTVSLDVDSISWAPIVSIGGAGGAGGAMIRRIVHTSHSWHFICAASIEFPAYVQFEWLSFDGMRMELM